MRAILHSDMNSYYASVEMMLNPELRGKAVAVCGSTETRHGIVLAKSEAAKKAGVKTGMVNWEARKCCPGIIMVPPHYEQYIKYSALARSIYGRYTDLIEPFGMDECWPDVTGSTTMGDPLSIAEEIRKATREKLGLTVSIGVFFNKIFAKLGSDMKKPDAITCITQDSFREQIWPLAANELMGIGPATTRKLETRGIKTIGDLAKCDRLSLKSWLGVNGIRLWEYANGNDTSRVSPEGYTPLANSVGRGITCTADLLDSDEVRNVLLSLATKVSLQLRELELKATGIQLFVRDNELGYREFQARLPYPTQSWRELVEQAMKLFIVRYAWHKPIRAVTIRAISLISEKLPYQLDLFGDHEACEKTEMLERTVDDIQRRFGDESILIAATMGVKMKKDKAREMLTMPAAMYVYSYPPQASRYRTRYKTSISLSFRKC